ncbi:Ig-like domain-containing protein [Planctomycetota bacterium]
MNTFLPAALAEVVLQPDGEINGNITVTPLDGGTTQSMTASNGAIGHFSDFDIAAGHTVTCSQTGGPNPNALFRIFSGDGTQILGQFDANGNIFLIDPAGILFGADAQINVNQLIASSLDIDDGDFLAGRYEFFAGEGDIGAIVNDGTINAAEGVALIGRQILNTGTITTGEGGFVVMAAGDRVLLGEPGSQVLVEMNSVALAEEGDGDVINDGEITAPAGTVVLASGDVFASALELPKVSGGIGRVEQNSHIHVDGTTGDGGSVGLTAADEVVLASGSQTTANAGTDSDAGLVVVHSKGRTTVDADAQIQATGGHVPEMGLDGFADVVETTVEITGDYVNFADNVNVSATDGKRGKIVIDALDMTIADGSMPDSPPDNTIYEEWIESKLSAATDIELIAHSKDAGTITVEPISDGVILGGDGDLVLRTKYDTGGITFGDDPATVLTNEGGNIYMLAGSGGITTGDVIAETPGQHWDGEPGKIRLLTTNYGNISTGDLSVTGGSYDEVSVMASGDLTINGNITTDAHQVDEQKEIAQARTCLISEHGSVYINGSISVDAHAKFGSTADIHIDAGQDVTINLSGGHVRATAQTSSSGPANASVLIHAGMDIEGAGTVLVTDDGVNPTTRSDAIYLEGKSSGVTLSSVSYGDDPSQWDQEHEAVYDEDGNLIEGTHAELEIDENRSETCSECPTPPGLIPPLDPWSFITHMGSTTSGDVLTDDSLDIINHTEPSHGTLTIDYETGEYEYTPEEGFVGQDRFTYQAITEDEIETDWVEVTIDITNELPVANPGSAGEHMGYVIESTPLDTYDVSDGLAIDDLIIDVVTEPEHGDVTIEWDGEKWIYTYTPEAEGSGEFYAGDDSFTYSVTDGQIDGEGNPIVVQATVEIAMDNNPPVQKNDTVSIDKGETVIINVLANDYDPDHPEYMDELTVVQDSITVEHGELILNEDNTFTYIPDPSYTGKDLFTYAVKDGQSGQDLVWSTVVIWVGGAPIFVPAAPFIPAAPVPEPIAIQVSGCPALVKWAAAELGSDEKKVQIWVANSLASPGNIQPCDACGDLKEAAAILQDADGERVAALAGLINEFASSTAPPTEEQMASIADAIANDIEGNVQYAAAGEYLDALAKYVGILNSELGFSADESVQFATNNYVEKLVEDENVGVAAYVASRLAALGGSQ